MSPDPELRAQAVTVGGRLGARAAPHRLAIARATDDLDPTVRMTALAAVLGFQDL